MARMIPKNEIDFNNSYGEEKLYNTLKKLDDQYIVFHSIRWKNEMLKDIYGEADFIILHPEKGILNIEVKSGEILLEDKKWYQINLENNKKNEMQDPMEQARRSKAFLIDFIKDLKEDDEKCYVESVVWFTSVNNKENVKFPPDYRKRVLFKEDLNNPEVKLEELYLENKLPEKTNTNEDMIKRIVDALAPHFHLVRDINSKKEENDYSFIRMTKEQNNLLDYMIEERKVSVQGVAGSGKTMIAIEAAKRLANKGEKVLFACFNSQLYHYLKEKYSNEYIDFFNLHSLIVKYINKEKIDRKEFCKYLEIIEDDLEYKNVIIDEGQDFNNDVIRFFSKYVDKKDGRFYLFYDKNQLIYQEDEEWIDEFNCRLVLTKNCRNTIQIGTTSNNIIDTKIDIGNNNIEGDTPKLILLNKKEKVIKKIEDLINIYIKEGFKKEEITILTLKTKEKSIINENKIGDYKLTENYNGKDILFTTSRKFKGLESNAIILIDLSTNNLIKEIDKKNFYVAVSRARQKIDMIGLTSEFELDKISKDIIDGTQDDGIIKIARKLKIDPIIIN